MIDLHGEPFRAPPGSIAGQNAPFAAWDLTACAGIKGSWAAWNFQ
ncbi:hypothetical protein AKJ09_07726 [Labilithrix luteola]|uniref:Uncharacterized protein n=1 Tax=Labilithrix luteola TaxID=1391654 RepID=A0A0K1Q5P6_9BACT|nr:hypothetical protein AKJ09_07726 [Labilithrix luteola]